MGVLWNHWFWITLGVLSCCGAQPSENSRNDASTIKVGEELISLPAGARGGKALLLPERYNDVNRFDLELGPTRRPSVSVSKSVSKVSVKMGKISVDSTVEEGENTDGLSGLEALAKISDIYVDRGIRARGLLAPRRIQPYYIGYNLVYRDPAAAGPPQPSVKRLVSPPKQLPLPLPVEPHPSVQQHHQPQHPTPPTNPNIGLLATIIAKLKSLAEATSSRIRFSNLLQEPVLLTTPAPELNEIEVGEDEVEGKPVEGEEEHHQQVLVRIDDLGVTTSEENQQDERADQPRSLEARGRSLPLPYLDPLDETEGSKIQSQDWDEGDQQLTLRQQETNAIKEVIKEAEVEEAILEEVMDVENSVVESDGSRSEELIQQGDFIQDFRAPEYSFTGDEDVKISAERIDQSNISAVVGVILGIIIFVIISIVLVLLGVQRRHVKNVKSTEPAEDVISQASYMTYSTTVSDHSVNYGPANWEKDMCEDLCSLDNDSFLNSLEAVTTTDNWGFDRY